MTGPEALKAFYQACALLKEGKPEEALAVKMLDSDLKVIQDRIKAASANTTKGKGKA